MSKEPPEEAFEGPRDVVNVEQEIESPDGGWKLKVRGWYCLQTDWCAASLLLYDAFITTRRTTKDHGFLGLRSRTETYEKEGWRHQHTATVKSTAIGDALTKAKLDMVNEINDSRMAERRREEVTARLNNAIEDADFDEVFETCME